MTRTVREAVLDLLRKRRMTTIFGNPGTTEVNFIGDLPEDFTYVLGLQESVVIGMADGYAQASGLPGFVNLHAAAGVGNAMGALYNAKAHKAPLVVTAGQQVRRLLAVGGHLMSHDATQLPRPLVKWSCEPVRAEDVPHAVARAINVAGMAPRGPAYVSIPSDDWLSEADENTPHHIAHTVSSAACPSPEAVAEIVESLRSARNAALVAGPEIDASGAWELAVRFASHLGLPVFAAPASGGGRVGFPEDHPLFAGILPLGIGPIGEALAAHDYVLVLGSSVFAYYLDQPGPALAPETRLVAITSDDDEAARAPVGEIHVADVRLTLQALVGALDEIPGSGPFPEREPPEIAQPSVPLSTPRVTAVLSELLPRDGILVVEAPTAAISIRHHLRMDRPGSFFYGSGGGLGWGLPASIGVAMACPDRPVVCLLGDGSAQYAIQGFWTAAAYDVPVTFVILRNDEYAVLKYLGRAIGVSAVPGCDLPGLEVAAVARDYGVSSCQVADDDALREALLDAIASEQPRVVEVAIAKSEAPF